MKILMAIDDALSCRDELRAMVAQFRPEKTVVRVLHVLQPIAMEPLPQMAVDYAPELDSQKTEARQLVERVAAELRKDGFEAETAVEVGDIRECIIDTAEQWGADLIIVASHGRRRLQRFLLGSVAESVARHAKCSVEIVRAAA
jgi:nucleotide-binding universal stress UspA family protein